MMLAYRGYASDFLETYTDNIAKVTAEDVQAVAQKYLHPDALTIVTVGNKANFDRSLDEFGMVNEIEIKQPEPPPAEPMPEASEMDMAKAKEVLAAAVDAHGGLEKLRTVKNTVMEFRASANSPMGPMQIEGKSYYLFPDKCRQDMKLPQMETSEIFDGISAFVVTPMGVQPLPSEVVGFYRDRIYRQTAWLLTNLSQGTIPIQYAGTEKVKGASSHILLVPQPSGQLLKVFVSKETHYIVKFIHSETQQGVTVKGETFIDDYRDVAGIKIPHHLVQNTDGELYIDMRITGVTLNAELDDTLFQEPN
jgi:hypothetical protein